MKAALRDFAGREDASRRLRERLVGSDTWKSARVVYGFLPMKSEPDWLGSPWPADKKLAFPRVEGEGMRFYLATHADDRGLCELGGDEAPPPDLVLVPGLAFDRAGRRLGRGGGFYDRWLEKGSLPTMGLCFACQIAGAIPCEPHDVLVRAVLTEEGFATP